MKGQIAFGHLVGNGAAQNISIGFIPDYVRVVNVTDMDTITEAFLGQYSCPFSSGGTTEIEAGMIITGATSGATATVIKVLVSSGTWAGGDAAGFFVLDKVDGTFGSENVVVGSGTDDATVTANVTFGFNFIDSGSGAVDIAAASSGNAAIIRYAGSSTAAPGFTIGSTIAEEAKLLRWVAMSGDYIV